MCGRFTLSATPEQLQQAFPGVQMPPEMPARYNIAPTQPVAVITNQEPHKLDFFTWGLVPSWAKDPSIGNRMINARAETLVEKPSFRTAFRRRRCLIPATGFYEWRVEADGKRKTPLHIRMADGSPFAFAGLWELWSHPDGSQILSCAIITTEPNELMKSIHNRMPAILRPESYAQWLATGEADTGKLQTLLGPYEPAQMYAYPVSRMVNSPDNDSDACIAPIEDNDAGN
jgi:putative SOS response-associated peptidase YedK